MFQTKKDMLLVRIVAPTVIALGTLFWYSLCQIFAVREMTVDSIQTFGILSLFIGIIIAIVVMVWTYEEHLWKQRSSVEFVPPRQEPLRVERPHAGRHSEFIRHLGQHIDQKV